MKLKSLTLRYVCIIFHTHSASDLKNVAEQKFNFRTRHFTPHYFKNHSKTEFY